MKTNINIVLIVWLLSTYACLGGDNCSSTKTYPYKTNTGPDNYDTFTVASSADATFLNTISGWFGLGSIQPTSCTKFRSHHLVCCSGEEKKWELDYTTVTAECELTPSIGGNCSGPINNLVGAINGFGFSSEIFAIFKSQVDGMGINLISAVGSYSKGADVSVVRVDECGYDEGVTMTASFIGTESVTFTVSGPSYSGLHCEFNAATGSATYTKTGWVVNDEWELFVKTEVQIFREARLGEYGTLVQTGYDVNIPETKTDLDAGDYQETDPSDYN